MIHASEKTAFDILSRWFTKSRKSRFVLDNSDGVELLEIEANGHV